MLRKTWLPLTLALGAFASCASSSTGTKSGVSDAPVVGAEDPGTPSPPVAAERLRTLLPDGQPARPLVAAPREFRLVLSQPGEPTIVLPVPRYELRAEDCPSGEAPGDATERERESTWQLFHDEEHAVALEFGAEEVRAWFWNEVGGCLVPLDTQAGIDMSMPVEIYGPPDAEVARVSVRRGPDDVEPIRSEKVLRDDLLLEQPGAEVLVVEDTRLAIVSPDGKDLFSVERPVSDLCFENELVLYDEPGRPPYVAVTMSAVTSRTCGAESEAANQTSHVSARSTWDEAAGMFLESYVDIMSYTGQAGDVGNTHHDFRTVQLDGARLVRRKKTETSATSVLGKRCAKSDPTTKTCLRETDCSVDRTEVRSETTWGLYRAADGITEIGPATQTTRTTVDGCAP